MEEKSKSSSVLCDLANEGKLCDIKNLAQSPEFICSSCGRIADYEENLCSPESMDEVC